MFKLMGNVAEERDQQNGVGDTNEILASSNERADFWGTVVWAMMVAGSSMGAI